VTFAVTLVGAIVGGIVGYFVGAFAGCDWLMPQSNLCGIYGLMLTGPDRFGCRRCRRLSQVATTAALTWE
jgi:hypothetical protein